MEDQIKILEEKVNVLEERINVLEVMLLKNPWEALLDDIVHEYIREHYPYADSCDTYLYFRVLDSMKEQIKTLLMGGDH